jgi:hypothetical protein
MQAHDVFLVEFQWAEKPVTNFQISWQNFRTAPESMQDAL